MGQGLPIDQDKIQRALIEVKFMQGLYEDALYEALSYLQKGREDGQAILQWLLREYCEPFQAEHQEMFKTNIGHLQKYKYCFGKIGLTDSKILWYEDTGKLIFIQGDQISVHTFNFELKGAEGIILLYNLLHLDTLLEYISETEYHDTLPNYKEPVYLYYDQDVFDALLQCVDFEQVLLSERLVLLIGEEDLEKFFKDLQAIRPNVCLGCHIESVQNLLNRIFYEKEQNKYKDLEQIKKYYSEAKGQVLERVRSGKPKILFITSIFTSILQYHSRDCRKAAEKMGLATEILIEKDPIYRCFDIYEISNINHFRPDLIFGINHFRFERTYLPQEVVYITWLQDPMPLVMSAETPKKLGSRDFIMNHFTTWKDFKQIGYSDKNLIEAAIPASSDIYQIYDLTAEELDTYACDICLVCHGSDVDAHIDRVIADLKVKDADEDMIRRMYKGYQAYVYETGNFFYSREQFSEFISGTYQQCFGLLLNPEALSYLTSDMYIDYNQRVYRQAMVDWILEAGFTNIKLWGNGWLDSDKYKPYAMGPAENGETLSKIYQASKVVLGNNVLTTSAARAWESMLSGAFYMSNYIPESEDVTDIRRIIEVGQDVIMFYNKQDLIEKLHYYLNHEDERQKMIERGREAALKHMTYDALMQRTLKEVAERLEEDENV